MRKLSEEVKAKNLAAKEAEAAVRAGEKIRSKTQQVNEQEATLRGRKIITAVKKLAKGKKLGHIVGAGLAGYELFRHLME